MKKSLLLIFLLLINAAGIAQDIASGSFTCDIPSIESRAHAAKFEKTNGALRTLASGNFDVRYYRCEWEVDPAVRYIKGAVTAYFVMTATGSTITLDLANELAVSSVQQHGVAIAFTHASNALNITLQSSLGAGAKDSVTITYEGTPPAASSAFVVDGHISGTTAVPILWTLSEPYGARDWWPCKNGLKDKADSVDIFITHPSVYKAASNGVLLDENLVPGLKTRTHWRHRYPIASYLVGFAVTNYEILDQNVTIGTTTIPFKTYHYPESQAAFQSGAQIASDALIFFSDRFGDYPFKNEKYGHVQFGWGGGMEHQTASFIVSAQEDLVVHELAHQWFGDKVTCASWSDIWLNEGFASFLTEIYLEHKYPLNVTSSRSASISYITSQPGGSVWVDDTTNVNRIFSNRLSYAKGSHLLYMLRWILGDATFFTAIQNYIGDPALAYGFATTTQLKSHLEAASGKDLTYFFSQWFTGQGYPSYQIEWYPTGNGVQVKIGQTQSHPSVGFFRLPVPLLFRNVAEGKEKLVVLNHTSNGQTFVENLGFQATEVVFDPDVWLITRNNTLTKSSGPLPVVFTTFEGKCENGLPCLTWETSEELNARHFEVQGSNDALHWEALGTVPAAGNSNTTTKYAFKPEENLFSYYRIKEMDWDGKLQHTRIITLKCTSEQPNWTIYPNPATDTFILRTTSGKRVPRDVWLYDTSGNRILLQSSSTNGDLRNFDIRHLQAGVYLVAVEDEEAVLRVVKE